MIIQAFKFGTFSKIPEFVDFKHQLLFSIQKAITIRQVNRLELLGAFNWKNFLTRVKKIDVSSLFFGKNLANHRRLLQANWFYLALTFRYFEIDRQSGSNFVGKI